MKTTTPTTKKSSTSRKVAVGVGAAVVAGVAAGAYYFYGSKDGKARREKASAWVAKARTDIAREVKSLKDSTLNEKQYKEIVKSVGKKYQEMKNLDSKDVVEFIKNVGSEWSNYATKPNATSTSKKVAVKRSTKKAATKAVA